MSCAEAPDIDLGAPPYDAAGFVPGGVFTPICSGDLVRWRFGNQRITTSDRDDRRFDFGVQFVTRIDNAAQNQDGIVVGNGGAYTDTYVAYIDELGNSVVIDFEAAEAAWSAMFELYARRLKGR